MINRPPHQAVDADRGVGADVTVVNLTNLAGPRPNDQATHTRIRNEHVRSAAEDRDRHLRAMSQRQRRHDLAAAARLDQPIGGAADAKRRERRQRHILLNAIAEGGAQHLAESVTRLAHDPAAASTAISARSCAINAAIASRGEHTANEIISPGPSCPARPMSALIAVAILG